jgi:hypothetical protein
LNPAHNPVPDVTLSKVYAEIADLDMTVTPYGLPYSSAAEGTSQGNIIGDARLHEGFAPGDSRVRVLHRRLLNDLGSDMSICARSTYMRIILSPIHSRITANAKKIFDRLRVLCRDHFQPQKPQKSVLNPKSLKMI